MSRKSYLVLGLVVCLVAIIGLVVVVRRGTAVIPVPITDGISQALAGERAQNVSAVRYELSLNIPENKAAPIRGKETVRFELKSSSSPLALDFSQPADHVLSVTSGGQNVAAALSRGHLMIPADSLHGGLNEIIIEFIAGDLPLNRNDDYLYSLFVPARASQTFPCFDQPDLKGSLSLTLEVPSSWVAVSNGFELRRETVGERTTFHFSPTQALPTYLFGFAAGKFTVERGERAGRVFQLYHRETDAAKVARNRDAIFDQHEQALEWLEDYTARKYPFEKLDFVLLPAFQFSGMEHAGVIFYNASSLLLDETATQEQELTRANTIAHETSHMWFGDLVTMKWFDDVWMKEVFANFMAAKIVNPSFPNVNHDLRFLLSHYPSAYDVDRTRGANPIRQTLDNLNNAGSLYGNIIYDKAPIVMRQLEDIVGADELRDGLREYLSRYAFRNATWPDLIQILDTKTDEDLGAWSRAWVDEPGRPVVSTELEIGAGDGRDRQVTRLVVSQTDPRGRSLIWNQRLQVSMGYANGTRITPLKLNAARVELTSARGVPEPLYVLPNGEGIGYGYFKLDDASRMYLLNHVPEIGDAVSRATAWITLWDDMLEGGTPPAQIIELALKALPLETEEQNAQRILSYLSEAYWVFLPTAGRTALAPRVEQVLRAGIDHSAERSLKAAYFSAFRRMALTADGVAYLDRLWRRQATIPGLTFAENDFIAMAQELAVRNVRNADAVLADELKLIENPDRKARFAFEMPALSPDEAMRDAFFASLASLDNRRHEPWVIEALAYLNHPLRAPHSERYIRPGLDLLAEIQRTGDIFFPTRWTDAILGSHNSPEAAAAVQEFLAAHNDYPFRLRQIVDQNADTLVRASKIVSGTTR